MRAPATLLAALFAVPAAAALAQPARPQAAAAVPATPVQTDAAPAMPQQTTATFGDWTLRCTRETAAVQSCEIVQGVSNQDRTIAQVAIGRTGRGQPLQMTILVPPSVSFARAATLTMTRESEPPVLELVWRRCLPGGCLADAVLPEELLRRIRVWTDPARIVFADGAGRSLALPFSPRGLAQAVDALARGGTE